MKVRTSLFAVVIGLFAVCAVVAQERVRGTQRTPNAGAPQEVHHHYYGAGAPGYGYGYDQRGFSGGLASGVGQGRLDTSQAAENYSQTAHQLQENHNYGVNSYYANKDKHDAYVAAHKAKPMSSAEREKFAKAIEPGRLSDAQFDRSTNVIHWPALLRDSEFTDERNSLDQLFNNRTPDNSGEASDNFIEIKKECEVMNQTLDVKLRKDDLPSVTFIACEHFINSLSYEGRFAAN